MPALAGKRWKPFMMGAVRKRCLCTGAKLSRERLQRSALSAPAACSAMPSISTAAAARTGARRPTNRVSSGLASYAPHSASAASMPRAGEMGAECVGSRSPIDDEITEEILRFGF